MQSRTALIAALPYVTREATCVDWRRSHFKLC